MSNIKNSLQHGRMVLKPTSPSYALDSEVLLSYVLKVAKTYLYTYPEQELTIKQLNKYNALLQKRSQGIPIAYLTKQQEFWSLQLQVSPSTLIPRADTELLVTKTLDKLHN